MGISNESERALGKLFSEFRLESHTKQNTFAMLLGRPDMLAKTKFSTPEDLFKSLGANKIDSLDVSAFEGANIIHDMNNPIPESLKGQYSLVYDNGTMEHCFDIKQFLFNINAMLHRGGSFSMETHLTIL